MSVRSPRDLRLDALGVGCAVADVEAIGVAEDQVAGGLGIGREIDVEHPPGTARAHFHRAHALAVQVGNGLAALQTIQLGRLGRAKAQTGDRVEHAVRARRPFDAQTARSVRVGVVPVRRAGVETAAESADRPVVAGVAHSMTVVVRVGVAFQARARHHFDSGGNVHARVVEGRQSDAVHVEVVVRARWAGGDEKRGTSGGSVLAFGERRVEDLRHHAGTPPPIPLCGHAQDHARTRLGVFLKRLTRQEVLQECH